MPDMHKLSMYLSDTWRLIFQGLDQAVSHEGSNFTLVTYDGNNFIRDSMNEGGEIDSDKLCRNIGKVIECEPLMKERLVSELEKARVTFAAVETVEQTAENAVANKCYFAIDYRDRDRALSIIADLNKSTYIAQVKPRKLFKLCVDRNFELCGISHVEPEIYETMQLRNESKIPFSAIRNRDGSYDLRVPAPYVEKFKDQLMDAAILCSASIRDAIVKRSTERYNSITSALAQILDSKKLFLVADKQYPDHFIKSDTTMVRSMVHTSVGDIEIGAVQRSDPSFQIKIYNILSGFSGFETILVDKDADKKLEALRENAGKDKGMELTVKTEYYKRSMVEHIREIIEGDYLGRMKDNEVRFYDAIDHAVMLGKNADDLKGDLQGDKQLNERALAGHVKESSIDLSDLNGEAFVQGFCSEVLLTKVFENEADRKKAEEEIVKNSKLLDLASESSEVKTAVINEVRRTVMEVQATEYDFVDIGRSEMLHEIEAKENIFEEIHIDAEERDF